MSDKITGQQPNINVTKSEYALNSEQIQVNESQFVNNYPQLEKSKEHQGQNSEKVESQQVSRRSSDILQQKNALIHDQISQPQQGSISCEDNNQCLQFQNDNQQDDVQEKQSGPSKVIPMKESQISLTQIINNFQQGEIPQFYSYPNAVDIQSSTQEKRCIQNISKQEQKGHKDIEKLVQIQLPGTASLYQKQLQISKDFEYDTDHRNYQQTQSNPNSEVQSTKNVSEVQQLSIKPIQKQSQGNLGQPTKPLMQLHQTDEIPAVELKPSPTTQNPTNLKFVKYSVQYFLKIETQVFTIEVTPSLQAEYSEIYSIRRRFSDFVFLFDAILTNHPGYILYPFPQKNLESFIKLKLNLRREEGEKIEMIEQRMSELEKFMNFLLSHPELRNSEEVNIFIKIDEDFEHQRKRIQSYVDEIKQIQSSSNINIMNLMDKGVGLISSYLSKTKPDVKTLVINKNDLEFGIILQKVQYYTQKLQTLLSLFTQLQEIQNSYASFTDIDTDVDALLKLCAKHSSGREYSRYFSHWVSNQMLQFLSFRYRQSKQIEEQLLHRAQISDLRKYLGAKEEQKEKQQKLSRRIQRFQRNFMLGWPETLSALDKDFQQYGKQFGVAWKNHQKQMIKIWNSGQIQ